MRNLEQGLARAFPELRVAPLTELAVGFHSVAVETADGVVFRIPRSHGSADGHATEFRTLPRLSGRLPVEVPLPEWRVAPGHPDFPFGAIGYRKLPGTHPEVGTDTLAAGVGAFLAALHSLDLDVPEAMPLQDLPDLDGVLDPDEVERAARWWDTARPELEHFEPVVRHGDPWYGNLLVDESGELSGVLDWEGLARGDPADDFAAQAYLGREFVEQVLKHYGTVDEAFSCG